MPCELNKSSNLLSDWEAGHISAITVEQRVAQLPGHLGLGMLHCSRDNMPVLMVEP